MDRYRSNSATPIESLGSLSSSAPPTSLGTTPLPAHSVPESFEIVTNYALDGSPDPIYI